LQGLNLGSRPRDPELSRIPKSDYPNKGNSPLTSGGPMDTKSNGLYYSLKGTPNCESTAFKEIFISITSRKLPVSNLCKCKGLTSVGTL